MKHIWTILCQKSSIDIENNLLSIFNCVEELNLIVDRSKLPSGQLVVPADFQLISYWSIDNAKKGNTLEVKYQFIDPKGDVLNEYADNFEIKKDFLRFRNRTNIHGLAITEAGRYVIKVLQKKEGKKSFDAVMELPLDVNVSDR